jgi:CheY-like chemotaxis protein
LLDFDFVTLASATHVQTVPALLDDCNLDGVRILAVDDSDINLEVAKRILELQGARVWLATNGQEALNCLRAEPNGFDVVLMDVQMPLMDGVTATRLIRGELGFTDLPIIALTAGVFSSERPKAIAAGMNDFITKPFDPLGLVRCVRDQARRYRLKNRSRLALAGPAVPNALSLWPEMDGVDYAQVRARLGNDARVFRSLLGKLIHDFADVALPSAGFEQRDLIVHAALMHKLKGSAGMLGLDVVQRLAATIERACEAGELEFIRPLAQQLVNEFRRLSDGADGVAIATAA